MENRDWVREALAAQEEHIKRSTSCLGRMGRSHAYRPHGRPDRPDVVISRCVGCGVTETSEDYDASTR